MITEKIEVENLKCVGCANTVRKGIEKIEGVESVDVNLDNSLVSINSSLAIERSVFVEALGKMGYPEIGTGNTIQKMKSYVSCAVGRMS